jgi:hypothetical protein
LKMKIILVARKVFGSWFFSSNKSFLSNQKGLW